MIGPDVIYLSQCVIALTPSTMSDWTTVSTSKPRRPAYRPIIDEARRLAAESYAQGRPIGRFDYDYIWNQLRDASQVEQLAAAAGIDGPQLERLMSWQPRGAAPALASRQTTADAPAWNSPASRENPWSPGSGRVLSQGSGAPWRRPGAPAPQLSGSRFESLMEPQPTAPKTLAEEWPELAPSKAPAGQESTADSTWAALVKKPVADQPEPELGPSTIQEVEGQLANYQSLPSLQDYWASLSDYERDLLSLCPAPARTVPTTVDPYVAAVLDDELYRGIHYDVVPDEILLAGPNDFLEPDDEDDEEFTSEWEPYYKR